MMRKKGGLDGLMVQVGVGPEIVFAGRVPIGAVVPRADNEMGVAFLLF